MDKQTSSFLLQLFQLNKGIFATALVQRPGPNDPAAPVFLGLLSLMRIAKHKSLFKWHIPVVLRSTDTFVHKAVV